MTTFHKAEVLEPEVLPPPGSGGPRVAENTGPSGINPILAGVIIDLLNVFTFGFVGFVAGGAVGIWAATTNRMPVVLALLVGVACGW